MLIVILQSILCLILGVCIYNFIAQIDKKIRPVDTNTYDALKDNKIASIIFLLTAIIIFSITVITNIFYKPLPGFYFISFFFLIVGLSAIFPSKGRKIAENCWVSISQRDNFLVTLNNHKILITGEMLGGKPDHVIYKEDSPKWLAPHENEPVSKSDYEYILKAILDFLEKHKRQGVIQAPGEHIGPYVTKEEIIYKYAKKGWKVEKLPDGSTKVSSPRLLSRLINLFSKKKK